MSTYINPFVDFGFKYIFGAPSSGEFLIDFLNSLFANDSGFEPIVSITYSDKEKSREREEGRAAVYDILCTTDTGRQFIVEMQRDSQGFFIDRSIYYMSRSICDQAIKGRDWNFQLLPVHFVSFMDFTLPELEGKIVSEAMLCDMDSHKPLSKNMRYTYIQLPMFDKKEEDCHTELDRWLFTLINMHEMDAMPFTHQSKLFQKLANVASYANLSPEDRREYDRDLKAYRDISNQLAYSYEQGVDVGVKQGIDDSVRMFAKAGAKLDFIANALGLSLDRVKSIIGKQ